MPNTTNPTPAEAEAARLQAENNELRAQLDQARRSPVLRPNTSPKPTEPSFGLSEGQRAELEMHGKVVSPFTGARQVGSGEPGSKPQVVDQATYEKTRDKAADAAPDPLA